MKRFVRGTLAVLLFASATPLFGQGTPLGGEFRINTYTTNYQWRESVAALPGGGFVVVWDSPSDYGTYGVFGQRYSSSGAPLGGEFRINTYTTGLQLVASVAALPSGFVVSWYDGSQDGSSSGIFLQRFDASGTPVGPEFRANSYTTGTQSQPSVSGAATGAFVVVWTSFGQDGSATGGVFGQRYASSGAPLGGEFQANTYTTGSQYEPRVSCDAAGNFVVLWSGQGGQDGAGSGIFGQRFASSGAASGGEFRVNGFTTGYQAAPDVAVAPGGDFVVVWESGGTQDGSSYGIFGQRFASSGATLGVEFRVNTYTSNSQGVATIATDATGNFVVAWTSNYEYGGIAPAKPGRSRRAAVPKPLGGIGSGGGIFGQRFAAGGAPLGSEFRVNTYTTNGQSLARVAVDATGGFVVVWSSNLEDGSQLGVFGQRYGAVLPVELTGFTAE